MAENIIIPITKCIRGQKAAKTQDEWIHSVQESTLSHTHKKVAIATIKYAATPFRTEERFRGHAIIAALPRVTRYILTRA